jgi:PAS domain S-box-containing protein
MPRGRESKRSSAPRGGLASEAGGGVHAPTPPEGIGAVPTETDIPVPMATEPDLGAAGAVPATPPLAPVPAYDRRGRRRRAIDDAAGRATDIITRERVAREAAEATAKRVTAQFTASVILAASPTVSDAIPPLLEALGEQLEWDIAACWCAEHEPGMLRRSAIWHAPGVASPALDEAGADLALPSGVGLPGRVHATGAPAWIESIEYDTNLPRHDAALRDELRSALAFPIRTAHEVFGVIELFSRDGRAPDISLVQTVSAIGNQVGQFVDRTRAQAALQRKEESQRFLAELSHRLASTLDLAGSARLLAELAVPTLGDASVVRLFPPAESPLAAQAIAVAPGGAEDAERAMMLALEGPRQGPSHITVPIAIGAELSGTLTCIRGHPARAYTADESSLVDEVARRASLAFTNSWLYAELARLHDAERRAREEAERAERKRSDLLESVTDAFVAYDRNWRFTYVNRPAADLFAAEGVTGDLIGKSLSEAFPNAASGGSASAMRRAMTERVTTTFESHSAGGRWYSGRVYPTEDGIVAYWSDVTERRRAEDAGRFLAEASERLAGSLDVETTLSTVERLLIPALADFCAIHFIQGDGSLTLAHVAHREPATAATIRDLGAVVAIPGERAVGAAAVARSGTSHLSTTIAAADLDAAAHSAEHRAALDALGLVSWMIVPLLARGQSLGTIALGVADTSRRYQPHDLALAEELAHRAALALDNARSFEEARLSRIQAEEANHAKTSFLTVMSHELRTPLNAIAGYAELMELGVHGPVTAEQVEALRRIQRSQRHLLSLINDVLNFARIEAGQLQFDFHDVPIQVTLSALEALVAPQLRAKELQFECAPSPAAYVAFADGEKIRQILVNLLSNAIKFTDRGGRIAVDAEATERLIRIRVSDTGCGIPADKLEQIFDPFVQLDRNLSSGHEGTGLGLSISRDLARAMDGELTVRSRIGHGSTFILTLPRSRPRGAGSRMER